MPNVSDYDFMSEPASAAKTKPQIPVGKYRLKLTGFRPDQTQTGKDMVKGNMLAVELLEGDPDEFEEARHEFIHTFWMSTEGSKAFIRDQYLNAALNLEVGPPEEDDRSWTTLFEQAVGLEFVGDVIQEANGERVYPKVDRFYTS